MARLVTHNRCLFAPFIDLGLVVPFDLYNVRVSLMFSQCSHGGRKPDGIGPGRFAERHWRGD